MDKIIVQITEHQRQSIMLLEIQASLLKKQYVKLELICNLLKEILIQQQQTKGILEKELISLLHQPLLDKNKVMDILNIKDSTYRRYVAKGYLRPMHFEKVDWYFEADLKKALYESRRKGRI